MTNKNYQKHFIEDVINMIASNNYEISDVTIDDFPKAIVISNIRMSLLQDESGKRDSILYLKENHGEAELVHWRYNAAGRFYISDWKKRYKDIPTLYKHLYMNINGIRVIMLIRRIDNNELHFEESEYAKYVDITIDNVDYSIIKAYAEEYTDRNKLVINEAYVLSSIFENNSLYNDRSNEDFLSYIDSDSNVNINEIPDETPLETEELF